MKGREVMVVVFLAAITGCAGQFRSLQSGVDGATNVSAVGRAEAQTCLDRANQWSGSARTNSVLSTSWVATAILIGTGGVTSLVGGAFIADTRDGGLPSDTRQWVMGTGSAMIGAGTALFFGWLLSGPNRFAAKQERIAMQKAALVPRILAKDDKAYGACVTP